MTEEVVIPGSHYDANATAVRGTVRRSALPFFFFFFFFILRRMGKNKA